MPTESFFWHYDIMSIGFLCTSTMVSMMQNVLGGFGMERMVWKAKFGVILFGKHPSRLCRSANFYRCHRTRFVHQKILANAKKSSTGSGKGPLLSILCLWDTLEIATKSRASDKEETRKYQPNRPLLPSQIHLVHPTHGPIWVTVHAGRADWPRRKTVPHEILWTTESWSSGLMGWDT